jgi:L-histidine N-alpha-methyltransferase
MKEKFKKDVNEGLSKTSKALPSKYFYDAIGDQIFVKIMHMPEYYLTRAEHEIFKNKTNEI